MNKIITRSSSTDHFSDLDGVRGLLSIIVMVYHYGLNTVLHKLTGLSAAGWGACVDFFFVLSGFVICKSITSRPTSVTQFAYKRFWRLFPLHLAIMLLFFPVLIPQGENPGGFLLNISAFSPLLLQEMHNGPAWSMGFEFYIPILFVSFIYLCNFSRPMFLALTLAFLIVASVSSYQVLSHDAVYFGEFLNHFRAVSGLGLGFCAWKIYETGKVPHLQKWNKPIFVLIVLSFFALVIFSADNHFLGFLLPFLCLAAMFVGATSHTFFSSWAFQWAGRLSFGIYMVHAPVLLAFVQFFGADALKGDILLKGLAVLLSLALAFILHVVVEVPAMRFGRRRHPLRA